MRRGSGDGRITSRFVALGAAIITALLSWTVAPASHAAWAPEDGDEAFTLGEGWPERTSGWQGVIFDSNSLTYLWPSRMTGRSASGTAKPCTSLSSGWCGSDAVQAIFYAQLPRCSTQSQTWCINAVYARNEAGQRVEGVATGSYPPTGPATFPGDAALGLPPGATPTLWQLPGITHSGGAESYLSVVVVEGTFQRDSPTAPWSGPYFGDIRPGSPGFSANLYPVKVQEGPYIAPGVSPDGYGVQNWNFGPECAQATDGSCARRYAFPTSIRFGVSVRLGQTPGSFFHGRLVEPTVSLAEKSGGAQVEIEGAPAKVPVVATWQRWADLPDDIRAMYPLDFNGPSVDYGDREWMKDVSTRVMISQPYAGGIRSMNELTAWLRFLGDKATAVPSLWSFSTVPNEELRSANSCFTRESRVSGIVTTNATSYSAGPPAFDAKTQTLDYKVAAPHFTRTGEVFSGNYTLALRSDVARCIYGFSKAPIKATIQVYGADGDSKVATTSVSEKSGWLTLTAVNFDFSQPTIQVKLTGKKKRK